MVWSSVKAKFGKLLRRKLPGEQAQSDNNDQIAHIAGSQAQPIA